MKTIEVAVASPPSNARYIARAELITVGVLVVVAFWLGPFIKRFGRS